MSLMDKLNKPQSPEIGKPDPTDTFVAEQQNKSDEMPKEGETIYILNPGFDSMTLQLTSGEVVSENRQFRLSASQEVELQALLKKGRPDIVQAIKKLDFKEAEAIARAHIAQQQNKQAGSRGASSSADKHRLAEELAKDQPRNLDVIEEDAVHPSSELNAADPQP